MQNSTANKKQTIHLYTRYPDTCFDPGGLSIAAFGLLLWAVAQGSATALRGTYFDEGSLSIAAFPLLLWAIEHGSKTTLQAIN